MRSFSWIPDLIAAHIALTYQGARERAYHIGKPLDQPSGRDDEFDY
jgi:hypothetical protein